MVVLLIVMGIGAVWMAASLPAWKQQATREKEAELVFRGRQYVHALALYQRRNGPGTRPASIDVLVDNKFLRRKYKDPITNDDFVPLFAGSAPTVPGQPVGGAQAPGQGRAGAPAIGQPAGGFPSAPSQGRAGQPGLATGQPAGQPGGTTFGGVIVGVASKSTAASILLYNGAAHYNEWQFVFVPQAQPGGQGGPGGPGGRPTGPGGGIGPGIGGPFGQRPGGPGGQRPGGPGRGGTPVPSGPGRGRGGA
jgi:type II secretory pathway pseudopilin PulG